jgi:hypothetical protein
MPLWASAPKAQGDPGAGFQAEKWKHRRNKFRSPFLTEARSGWPKGPAFRSWQATRLWQPKSMANWLTLSHVVERNGAVSFVSARSKKGLEILRHSAAHVMAQAVKELFPGVKVDLWSLDGYGFFTTISITPGPSRPKTSKGSREGWPRLSRRTIPL